MRRVVLCTACDWTGQRLAEGGPCPMCDAPVAYTERSVGRPPSEILRERLEVQVEPETIYWLGVDAARKAAEILDRAPLNTLCNRCGAVTWSSECRRCDAPDTTEPALAGPEVSERGGSPQRRRDIAAERTRARAERVQGAPRRGPKQDRK